MPIGDVCDGGVIEALDALEANRFLAAAEAAAAWRTTLPDAERRRRDEAVADVDRSFDGIE